MQLGDGGQIGGAGADTVIDAAGGAVMPGLIDSHFHVVFGEYQPRQKVVDFIDSYVHGGVTSMISAGEIHTPGRPRDKAGVKALAIAAQRFLCCLSSHRSQSSRRCSGVGAYPRRAGLS